MRIKVNPDLLDTNAKQIQTSCTELTALAGKLSTAMQSMDIEAQKIAPVRSAVEQAVKLINTHTAQGNELAKLMTTKAALFRQIDTEGAKAIGTIPTNPNPSTPAPSPRTPLYGKVGTIDQIYSEMEYENYLKSHGGYESAGGKYGSSANCGPTSLVMALSGIGLLPQGATSKCMDGDKIGLARNSMVTDPNRDGYNSKGQYSDKENQTGTSLSEVIRGANAAGAKTERNTTSDVNKMITEMQKVLQSGGTVVATGTFEGKSSSNTWDSRTSAGHIISVTGYDSSTGKFFINDPAQGKSGQRAKSIEVTAQQLSNFMKGNAGYVGMWKK